MTYSLCGLCQLPSAHHRDPNPASIVPFHRFCLGSWSASMEVHTQVRTYFLWMQLNALLFRVRQDVFFNKEFEQMKQKNIQIKYWAVLFETFQLQKQFAILRNLSISTLRCLCCPEEKPIILLYCADGRGVGPEPHVRSDGEQQQCCSCTSSTARTLMTNLYFIKTFWSSTAALWAYSWWATHGEVQFLYDYLQINIGFTAITTKRIMVQTHTVVNMAVLVIASNCSVILWGRAVAYITVMAFAETVLQKWLEWDCGLQFLWLPCIIRGHSSS